MDKEKEVPSFRFEANNYPLSPGTRLIEASAGTGKTFAITHIVLRLLTEGRYKLNQLLVVTFTEAAAAELKARICARIEEALYGLEALEKGISHTASDEVLDNWLTRKGQESSQRRDWTVALLEALEKLNSADITTIHGFCMRTLRRKALENGSFIEPKIESDGKELVQEVVHDYWQKHILTLRADQFKGITEAGLTLKNLTESLLKVDADASLNIEEGELTLDTSKPLTEQFDLLLKDKWLNFLKEWNIHGKSLEEELRNKAMEWRSLGAIDTKPFSPKPTKDRHEIISNWIEEVTRPQLNLEERETPTYEKIRNQILLGNYYHPSALCQVARRCAEENQSLLTPNLQVAIAELWDTPAEEVWKHALHHSQQVLNERRLRKGVMSYAGLLKALDSNHHSNETRQIKHDLNLLSSLQDRYCVALIDEFQDTDPIQWRLLKNVFADSTKHLLIMVGDPKQAIYRFRGGDLRVYMQAKDEVERIDALVDNYRTANHLLEGLNKLMAQGLNRSNLKAPLLTAKGRVKKIPIPKNRYPLQILNMERTSEFIEGTTSAVKSKSKQEEMIPIAVSNAILEILRESPKEIKPSDICILVNRHDQAKSIRKGLAGVGLPSKLITQGDVLTSEAAKILQYFLDCLANPSDAKKIRLLASSPLLQWRASDLGSDQKESELDLLCQRFDSWAKNLNKLGLLGCLSELLAEEKIADLSQRGHLLSDLHQCAQIIEEEITMQGMDAGRAARWLRRQRLQPFLSTNENRQPNSDIAESAVGVVTIHRSKGMEYEIVICPYLWQAPPVPSGPLWRPSSGSLWQLSLNKDWGRGRLIAEQNKQESIKESERLAYVALTRARNLLIVVWTNSEKQENNPISSWLFGPDAITRPINQLTTEKMQTWIRSKNIPITINEAIEEQAKEHWVIPVPKGDLKVGPIPKRTLDICWGRYSYSSWTSTSFEEEALLKDPIGIEEGRDLDQQDEQVSFQEEMQNKESQTPEISSEDSRTKQSPLSDFPRGSEAGECLHKIIERVNLWDSPKSERSKLIIEEELRKAGLEINLLTTVQSGLERVFSTPFWGALNGLRLDQLNPQRCIHELSFDLPIAHNGNVINSSDISKVFQLNPEARYGPSYARRIIDLNISSRGFLTGSIDLVFTDNEDPQSARWWVADWKSNWIGQSDPKGELISCSPINYTKSAMEQQMLFHHYPLQAHLYLVALHRYLQWRLKGYDPSRHLGGYAYVFLRGLPESTTFTKNHLNYIPGLIVEPAPLDRILELNKLFEYGGA